MENYTVSYKGNSLRFKDFSREVNANSEREAVELVYGQLLDDNYFPQTDNSILDCDGCIIADGKEGS